MLGLLLGRPSLRRHSCRKCTIDNIIHLRKAFGHGFSLRDNLSSEPFAYLAFARSLLYVHICSQQRRYLPKPTNNGRIFHLHVTFRVFALAVR